MKTPTHFIIGYGFSAVFGWRGGLRRALVPDHEAIGDARIQSSLRQEKADYSGGVSRLRFRLPHSSGDALGVKLRPGSASYLMMAWSHARDFAHHSAFREHREVVL